MHHTVVPVKCSHGGLCAASLAAIFNLCGFLQAVAEDNNGKLKVYLRVRPLTSTEVEKGEDQVRH